MSGDTIKAGDDKIRAKKTSKKAIPLELIARVRKQLLAGKPIRQSLPLNGLLNIDRTLPFLVVYRKPINRTDSGTEMLVNSEASFLIASAEPRQASSLSKLVRAIAETLSGMCKSFLIIEIWSDEYVPNPSPDPNSARPSFKILTSPSRPPTHSIEALKDALLQIVINKRRSLVEVDYNKHRAPQKLTQLIPPTVARKMNCFVLGLEINPVYFDEPNQNIFPLALRRLEMGFTAALKKAVFVFSVNRTNISPGHYHALGKRALVRAVWEIDRKLSEISNQFDFLLMVTPINSREAWLSFQKHQYEKIPALYYRLRPVDPALLKRQLYNIPIEKVEDPVLANLFRETRIETARKLTMLEDRNTRQFIYSNIQLYGTIDEPLRLLAQQILTEIQPHSRNGKSAEYLNAAAFAEMARKEIEYYHSHYEGMASTVSIRDDVVGLLVAKGNLLLNGNLKISSNRADALLQHEVGTHVLTYYNGRAQPLKLLSGGLPGYEELQEGLAVLAEYLVGGLSRPRLRLLAARVMAAHAVIEGATFIDTFRLLNKEYNFDRKTAFSVTVRMHRGGGLTKDAIYLRGLAKLYEYLKGGGDLESLYVGKMAFEHIPIIQELQWRQVLHPMPLKPRYLENNQIKDKLLLLRNSASILNLISQKKKKV